MTRGPPASGRRAAAAAARRAAGEDAAAEQLLDRPRRDVRPPRRPVERPAGERPVARRALEPDAGHVREHDALVVGAGDS